MQNIKLLDCTLRDGGYINNWTFGKKIIQKVVSEIARAGIDVIECGYLSMRNAGDEGTARFNSIKDVHRVYTAKTSTYQKYAVMVNFGEYPIEKFDNADSDDPIIRVAFHKKDLDDAFIYCENLKRKGYCCIIQPMGALNYTDEEFVQMIKKANILEPEAFYIVDSFGVMELKDFQRLLFLTDNNLRQKIILGYHSHNNLQQAYSNSKFMVEQNLDHDIIIDASVFGMGRGAGNLNIELFAKYLNQNFHKNYNIEPILEVFDECLKPIFAKNFWGYSLPFYLSAIHNCHPNYASYFSEKNTLSVRSMHELLSMISEEDKTSFSPQKANDYYTRYQENYVDDQKALDVIKKTIGKKEVLILAPGQSLKNEENIIKQYIDRKNPVIFGINHARQDFYYEFLFIANEKRLPDKKPDNVKDLIITSNLKCNLFQKICVNYVSYLNSDSRISDDPTLMLINLLIAIGVRTVAIAGFDGFSANPDDNYFEPGLSLGSNIMTKMHKNEVIKDNISKIREQIELIFLTPSRYLD
ncbi:MAG: aldolase catalytic domain-containing protein [Clostridium sp.]|nr:aldolase catalytic domain-containing protein [Clostridium sp.]